MGGWVGPRAVLDAVVKRKIPSLHWESNPRTPIIQPIAQSCTNCAITSEFLICSSLLGNIPLNRSMTVFMRAYPKVSRLS
jgi:hypothetical protein